MRKTPISVRTIVRAAVMLSAAMLCGTAALLAAGAARAGVGDDLDRRWKGAWVVVEVPVQSDCRAAGYADNDVNADLVHGKGGFEFEAGELARVHQVRLRRKRVEVQVDLLEPVLAARQDGPFTLYDRLLCKVELQFRIGKELRGDLDYLDGRIAELFERHTTSDAAHASSGWNGREVEPFPADYAQTLSDYEVWKVEQHNAAVEVRRREALDRADDLIAGVESGPDYAAGFAAGVHANRRLRFDDCGSALAGARKRRDDKAGGSEDWRRGLRDGRALVDSVRRAEYLEGCYLEPPVS